MNAEELEIARRLVACKGWVWVRGMRWVRKSNAPSGGMNSRSVSWPFEDVSRHFPGALPDLSDDLTRLGVLAVVRRAWGDKTASVRAVDCYPLSAMWTWIAGQPGVRRVGHERTELAALLAALEAAP